MADRTEQRSELDPDAAESRRWIGVHFNWLCMRNKTLEEIAYNWVKSEDKPAERRVVINKQLGDVYREVTREADPDAWRRCIPAPGSPLEFDLGQVPAWVQFLTAGQDSRSSELHWAIWGWGMVRDVGGLLHLCGCPVALGVVPRQPPRPVLEAADLAVFDQLLYDQRFPGLAEGASYHVSIGFHDSGWQPVAVYGWTLTRRDGRAFPATGAGLDEVSAARTQIVQMGLRPGFKDPLTGQMVREAHAQKATLNTYVLKGELVGMVDSSFPVAGGGVMTRVVLARNTPEEFIRQSGSEYLARNDKGKLEWRHRGPNHWADCNHQALAAALYLRSLGDPEMDMTAEEQRGKAAGARVAQKRAEREEEERRESGGGWWTGTRDGGWL